MRKRWIWIIGILLLNGCATHEATYTSETDTGFMYERQQLSEAELEDYNAIYDGLMSREEEIEITSMEEDEMVLLYEAVMNDHPEIFWVDNFEYNQLDMKIFGSYSILYPVYNYTKEEIEDYQQQLEAKSEEIISAIPQEGSDYDKVKAVYDYIIDHTNYVLEAADNQNIISVLLKNESVCAGYAKTMQYLLEKMGVSCSYIVGEALENNISHAWNMVKMDGEYYYVDATFGDPIVDEQSEDNKTYAFLGFTSDEMLQLYKADSPYEETDAITDNYFMKENAYVDDLDSQQFMEVMQKEENLEERKLSFKCNSEDMLTQLKTYMLDESQIYQELEQIGVFVESIYYVEYAGTNVITFEY